MKEIVDTLHGNQAGSLYSIAAITALILLCASFQASTASKENAPTQTSSSKFNKLDSTQDAKLSRKDAASDKGLTSSFNADGTLDAKEYDSFTSTVQKK